MADARESHWINRLIAIIGCILALTLFFKSSVSGQSPALADEIAATRQLAPSKSNVSVEKKGARTDELQDALPPQARFRIGTDRFLHRGAAFELALAPDEKSLVTWGTRSIVSWDTATGKERWSEDLDLNGDTVYGTHALAFSGDSIYSQSEPNALTKWNNLTGKFSLIPGKNSLSLSAENRPASALPGSARSIDVSHDGSRIAAAGGHGVVVFNASGESLFELPNSPKAAISPEQWKADSWLFGGHYSSAVFSPDGAKLAVILSQSPHQIQLLDATTGRELQKIQLDSRAVRVTFSPTGKSVATTERNCTVAQHSVETGFRQWERRLEQVGFLESSISAIIYSPDGKQVAVAGSPLYILDATNGLIHAQLNGSPSVPRSLAITADSNLLYALGENGIIERWDLRSLKQLGPPQGFHSSRLLVSAARSTKFAYVDALGAIHLGDASVSQLKGLKDQEYALANATFSRLAISRDGKWLASGATVENGLLVAIWGPTHARTLKLGELPKGIDPRAAIRLLEFSPDGSYLAASIASDDSVYLWNVARGELIAKVQHKSITCLTFDRLGEKLITGGADDVLRFWDSKSGEVLSTKELAGGALQNLRCSPVEDLIVTAHFPNVLRFWNSRDMTLKKRTPLSGEANFEALEFSSNGNWLATNSSGYLTVLDAKNGAIVWKVGRHRSGQVTSLGFVDSDKVLVSSGSDGVGYGWDLLPEDVNGIADFEKIWSELRDGSDSDMTELTWRLVQIGNPAVDAVERRLDKVKTVVDLRAITRSLDTKTAKHRAFIALQLCEKDPEVELQCRIKYAIDFLSLLRNPHSMALLKRLAAEHPSKVIRREAMFALEEIE